MLAQLLPQCDTKRDVFQPGYAESPAMLARRSTHFTQSTGLMADMQQQLVGNHDGPFLWVAG